MSWLRKLINEIIEICFMMVGITPPSKSKKKDESENKT